MSRSRVMNPFSSLLKDYSFRRFKAQKYFLNTLRWLKFVMNVRRAIFFKEWAFSEQLILLKIPMFFISTAIENKVTMKRWMESSLYLIAFFSLIRNEENKRLNSRAVHEQIILNIFHFYWYRYNFIFEKYE